MKIFLNICIIVIYYYAYWKGIYIRDIDELENEVIELNNSFIELMNNTEIKEILRCISKVIDKFTEYYQVIRNYERKRVSIGRRGKGGLNKREQDRIQEIKYLKEEGLSQSKVAKKLNIGIATVKRYWNF